MKNTLAENMLRFGAKNLDAKATTKLKKLAEQTATGKSVQQWDPGFLKVEQYFANEHARNAAAPSIGTANLIYVGTMNSDRTEFGYNVAVYRAAAAMLGDAGSFIMPFTMGLIDFRVPEKKFSTSPVSMEVNQFAGTKATDANQLATVINEAWNKIPSAAAVRHIQGRNVKLAPQMAAIKTSTSFPELGSMLTGTAKAVYDIIAA
jgi:hypothetical protein